MTTALRAALLDTSPLPEGWSPLEIVEDTVVADGVRLHRAGLASVGPDGEEVTGSAAGTRESPAARGYFELLERIATVEALRDRAPSYEMMTAAGAPAGRRPRSVVFPESDDPAKWRYARSNGVALHADWATACERARWELAERDRVLRAWYGDICPHPLAFPTTSPLRTTPTYEWVAYSFPEPALTSFSVGVEVVGVFGFPRTDGAALVTGFGARGDVSSAFVAASGEAMQLLAFLHDEVAPASLPAMGPTPGHHQDRFQWHGNHAPLRRWLAGAHVGHARQRPAADVDSEVAFVDLTPSWLGAGLRVAKAICTTATPLTFGEPPCSSHLPEDLRAHPIA
jgi:ribosomal protein S12 methylthiotransferase accessory factor YcaO